MQQLFTRTFGRLALGLIFLMSSCGQAPAGIKVGASPSAASVSETKAGQGTLAVHILWPIEAPTSLRTAAIPDSTATISLKVSNSNGFTMGTATVSRSSGQTSVTANITVAIGTNYSLLAAAEDSSSTLVAQGSAAGFSVTENNTTPVSVVMAALTVPAITAIGQANGGAGVSLALTGTSFGFTRSTSLQVYFDATANSDNTVSGTQASTVNRTSDTAITVTVPSGASNGNIIVRSDGIPSASTISFIVIQAVGVSPSSATIAAGATQALTISATDTSSQAVTSPVLAISSSDTTTATIDASNVVTGVAGGSTTISATSGSVSGTATIDVTPVLSSLTPSAGAPGTPFTLTGTGFRASQGTSTVTFNGVDAGTAVSWSTTSIVILMPTGAGSGNVVVTVHGQASNGIAFSGAPVIGSLSVPSGIVGDAVTLTGVAFGASQGASTVKFNGTPATATNWGDTSIVTAVPAGASSGNVVVTVAGQPSNGLAFTVLPHITSLTPTSGNAGDTIAIAGTSFGPNQGSSTVKFNGTAAVVISWGDTSIHATVPTGVQSGNVVVNVGGNNSNGVAFSAQGTVNVAVN